MNKISKLLKGISAIIQKPYLINKVIDDESWFFDTIKKVYPQYAQGFLIVELNQLLPEVNETIEPFAFLGGGSLPTDLLLLKGLAKQYPECFYFEIGTWRGESAANVSAVTPNVYTLNLTNQELTRLGYGEEYLKQQGLFSNKINTITHLRGNSTNFDFSPYYGKCDVVFIDGDHRYDGVLNDTKIAFKLVKDDNSVIVWHDYINHSFDIRWDVVQGILDGCETNNLKHLYHVNNSLSAIFTKKDLKPVSNKPILTPNKIFKVKIDSKNYKKSPF
ncbi:MAG: class I SAM-dependent methyltransferase [Flavobacteriales bacterium]